MPNHHTPDVESRPACVPNSSSISSGPLRTWSNLTVTGNERAHLGNVYTIPPECQENVKEQIDQGNQTVLLDISAANNKDTNTTTKTTTANLKLARDNHAILIPQPSPSDPHDPLNWSPFKKHIILFILALSAFIGDFGSGAGIPCIALQGAEWGISPGRVLYATNLNVLLVGIGGVLWIPPLYFWGRAPVLLWSTVVGMIFTLLCAVAGDFETYYAARAIVGLSLTAGQTIGLAFVKDMFFFHEHARKLGLWYAFFTASPYVGPLLANFMVDGLREWRPVFWLIFAFCCLDLVLILAFADETWYRRDGPKGEQQPERGSSRLARVVGLWQVRNHSYFLPMSQSFGRLAIVFFKPAIIPSMLYHAMSVMWAVGINLTSSLLFATPVAAGGYGYSTKAIGFLYFTPIVGVLFGEAFGHYFNDWLAAQYSRTHQGVLRPEVRLRATYIGAALMIPGLILVVQALERHLSVGAIIMGWGMYVFGVMVSGVAITAYVLDCYPNGAGEVSSFLNFARTIGGFSLGYFQQPWGQRVGFGASFGTQAALVGVAMGIVVLLQVYGQKLTVKSGPLEM